MMVPPEKLSPVNFLSVCDVAMDILEALQMSKENIITVPVLRNVIRPGFNILMPGGDIDSASRYCDYRLKAVVYLKNNGLIDDVTVSDDHYFFNRSAEITVNREAFNKFYGKLAMTYQKRVVDPAIKEQVEARDLTEKTVKENKILATNDKNYLRSIHLVTACLEPTDVIFAVLDGRFNMPIRCSVKNNKGEPAYIKKLYDIAYLTNAPGKMVSYDEDLSDTINNGLFKRRPVKEYMRTNHLKKPTLVKKSEDGKTLVLTQLLSIETLLIKNTPSQYQNLYVDKTR